MRPGAGLALATRGGAKIDETTARLSSAALLFALALLTAGCSGRPYGNLIVGTTTPGAGKVDMLVATTRAAVSEPPGVLFGGARGRGLDFADIIVSIPPDGARRAGEVQWPSSPPGEPERSFVTLRADRLDLEQIRADFDRRGSRTPPRKGFLLVRAHDPTVQGAGVSFVS